MGTGTDNLFPLDSSADRARKQRESVGERKAVGAHEVFLGGWCVSPRVSWLFFAFETMREGALSPWGVRLRL